MENESLCPEQFHWLYAGIDFSIDGNGGPKCAQYLSPFHRLIETVIIISASIIEIVWSLRRVKYDDNSCLTPITKQKNIDSSQSTKEEVRHFQQSLDDRLKTKTILLIIVSLIFGIEIGYKLCTNSLVYLLNPCHILTITLIYLLAADERKQSNTIRAVFRVHLHLLSGALLAILLPVVNTRFLSFEKHSYWVHHILIYLIPGYLLTLGGPYTAEPLKDKWWPMLSIGIGFLYHFTVLQGLSLLTHANLNNMLCPAVSDPFEGPFYRLWAFVHQHLLNILHGKSYQLATFAVVSCISKVKMACKATLSVVKLNGRDENFNNTKKES